MHLVPFPRNPSLHVYDPRVLLHSAFTSQSCVPSAHSSKSRELKKGASFVRNLFLFCYLVFCGVVVSRLFALINF